MSVFRACPKFVTLTGGCSSRGENVRDPKSGMWYYQTRPNDVDEALVEAYTENVGHPPHNLSPLDPGYEQWTYNPRKKNSKPLSEIVPCTMNE